MSSYKYCFYYGMRTRRRLASHVSPAAGAYVEHHSHVNMPPIFQKARDGWPRDCRNNFQRPTLASSGKQW
ncbi:hypothetical protein Bca52824_092687 [Brassica carinata]|uniref:Uncharacterized protein n=1 Tax=Brassica carinata TaxID=52824 RepID=A0A8X7P7J7_BRACI|nr:hypothetical protein Bca52824_092687 [Brassica carinata]